MRPDPAPTSTPDPSPTTPTPSGATATTATAVAPQTPKRDTVPGPSRQTSSVWATPDATTARPRPITTSTQTPAAREKPVGPLPDVAGRRALPTASKRSTRPDVGMMLAAAVVGLAAYQAWDTFVLRWVQISLSRADTEGNVSTIGTASFRASEALAGTLGHAVVVVLGASALLWFFFSLQRGWSMPWFATPAIATVAALLGFVGTALSSVVWFVWRDAMVEGATRFGLTRAALLEILDDSDRSPVVDLQRLAGPGRFGSMLALALVASLAAWWSYRKRAS